MKKYVLRPKRKSIVMRWPERLEMTVRSALFYLLLAFCSFMYSLFSVIFYPLPLKIRYPIIGLWPRASAWIIVHILGIRIHIENPENLRKANPCVFVSNHHSACEIILFSALLAYPTSFVLKRELLYHPLLGPAIIATGLIPISRGRSKNDRERVIAMGKKRLEQGLNIVLFPEGTRMPAGIRAQYKMGAMELAFYSQRPIVPIAQNSGLLWPRLSFLKRKGTITFVIGEPIDTKDKNLRQIKSDIQRWTHRELDRIESPDYQPHSLSS